LGGWVFDFLSKLGVTSDVVETFTEAIGEVAATRLVEVAVKEPKQISTRLVRMSTMLARKTTQDRAAMLHSEFLISPTWRANYMGVRPG
jgi:ubiquinone biosynthesis protein UbiJ